MDKRFLGILGGIIIIFGIIFAITQSGNSPGNPSSNTSSAGRTHNVEGQDQKGVTLVEWGDYECPICEAYYQPLKQAVSQLLPDIQFQFSNLPLTAIHPNAFAAARAAQAAGLLGKFWQMHDQLYENQNEWVSASNPQSFFDNYAKALGLNVTKFDSDYASSQVNDAINADLAAFAKTGKEQATPTFFLDGQYVDNSQLIDSQTGQPSAAKITAVINAEIAKK